MFLYCQLYLLTTLTYANFYNYENLFPVIPNYTAQISLQWLPIKSISIDAQFQSVGRQYLNDANTLSESSYFFSNLKISNRFRPYKDSFLTLYIGVNNIIISHNAGMVIVNAKSFGSAEPRYYQPSLPRHAYMGVNWSFQSISVELHHKMLSPLMNFPHFPCHSQIKVNENIFTAVKRTNMT